VVVGEPDRHPCRCPPFPGVFGTGDRRSRGPGSPPPVLKPPARPGETVPRLGRIRGSQRLLEARSSLDPAAASQGVAAALNPIAQRRFRGHAQGASSTLTIVATLITNLARNERRISNTAFIADFGTTSDPNPGNDQASTIVQVAGPR
jgi:hypothetical protein